LETAARGPSLLFLQRNISHRSIPLGHLTPAIGASLSDMERQHYRNFSVVYYSNEMDEFNRDLVPGAAK
jgi:hypothetical protein